MSSSPAQPHARKLPVLSRVARVAYPQISALPHKVAIVNRLALDRPKPRAYTIFQQSSPMLLGHFEGCRRSCDSHSPGCHWGLHSRTGASMKVRNSLKSLRGRHRDNRMVRRKDRVYVINKTNRRFKARQG